jgi:hypothetical protein
VAAWDRSRRPGRPVRGHGAPCLTIEPVPSQ